MSFDLNELRAQRDRIREHLAWLDRQIARAEVAQDTPSPKPAAKTDKVEPQASVSPTAPSTPIPLSDKETAPMQYSPDGFGSSSKFGCIASALALAATVIFLLFGLPYLLPPTEFEQTNLDMVAALDTRVDQLATKEQKTALRTEMEQELDTQRDRLQAYLKAEEGLSKEAQSTKKTINDLEALLDKLRYKALDE